MSPKTIELLKKIFVKDPLERLSIEGIKKSNYFAGVEWDNLDYFFYESKDELARKSSYVSCKR